MRNDPFPTSVTRRRALTVLASAASLPLIGAARADSRMPELEWRGRALGGPARITIRLPDEAAARKLAGHCALEIERLENIFSLHRPQSELTRLNSAGRLEAPSHDLRLVLAQARRFGHLSDGAFDVTVQPLWRLYSGHFAAHPQSRSGPPGKEAAKAAKLVDYRGIDLDNGRAVLARPGMAVTLNGIAQGYITDRITEMLRDAGMMGVLVDIGEIRALAPDDGKPWRVGIENPRLPGKISARLLLSNEALATSGGYGTVFGGAGRFHHLFDPATGESARRCLSASVVALNAMTADALATALAVAGPDRAEELLHRFQGHRARLVLDDGSVMETQASGPPQSNSRKFIVAPV